jgi:uncharacterized protein
VTGGALNQAAFEPDGRVFWHALDDGRFELQRCSSCGRFRFPPSEWCNACLSSEQSWVAVSGSGSVYSWTTTHHAPRPEFKADVPYTLVMVQLAEQDDVVLVGRYLGDAEELAVGVQVAAELEPVDGGTLIAWNPAESPKPSGDRDA